MNKSTHEIASQTHQSSLCRIRVSSAKVNGASGIEISSVLMIEVDDIWYGVKRIFTH